MEGQTVMMRSRDWLLLVGLVAGLGACGKVGLLEQPAPLYGEKAKAEFKARQAGQPAADRPVDAPSPIPAQLAPPEPGSATPIPSPPTAPAAGPQ
jgi:hypothetical protein